MGADGYFQRPALESLRMDLKCTGRARSRGGALAPLEAPLGPHAARREALERRGGMGFPPWGFLTRGAPRKGGSRGENQGGGREARPVLSFRPADLRHFPGRAGAQQRSSCGRHRARADPVGGPRDAKPRGEARSEEARSSAGHVGRHSEAAVTAEHGLTACHLHERLHLVQAVGSRGADASSSVTLPPALRSRAPRAARRRLASRQQHHCAGDVRPGASPRARP